MARKGIVSRKPYGPQAKKVPPTIDRILRRRPKRGSDEANYRAMLAHAGIEWAMTASDKGWHGYAIPGLPTLAWFDPDSVFLGYTE